MNAIQEQARTLYPRQLQSVPLEAIIEQTAAQADPIVKSQLAHSFKVKFESQQGDIVPIFLPTRLSRRLSIWKAMEIQAFYGLLTCLKNIPFSVKWSFAEYLVLLLLLKKA